MKIGKAQKICGITLKWDYVQRTCELLMPGYIEAILKRFHHPRPINPELAPRQYAYRSFSANNTQAPIPDDDTARLDASGVFRVQRVVGCVLYYARAIDTPSYMPLQRLAPTKRRRPKKTGPQQRNS